MKKTVVVVLMSVMLSLVTWLGATFYLGLRIEQVVRDDVAKMQLLPGRHDIALDVLRYERGLFTSTATICLILQDELAAMPQAAALSGQLCAKSTLHHGPLAFTDNGLRVGLASTREVLDLSGLPPEATVLVEQVFDGQPPIIGNSFFGFDGSVSITLAVSPMDLQSPMGSVTLSQLQVEAYRAGIQDFPVNSFLTLKGLKVDGGQGQIAVESLTGSVDVMAMLDEGLPLTNTNLTGEGLLYSQHDLPLLGFDLTLQASSQITGDTLAGTNGLWLDNVIGAMVPIAMDSAYLGVNYSGIDKQALIRVNALNNEIEQLQTTLLLDTLAEAPAADPEQAIARMTDLGNQMVTVLSEALLHPGDTTLAITLLMDHQQDRQLSLDARTRYLGFQGSNLPLTELEALTDQQLNQMLDISMQVDMDQAVIPPPLAVRLPGLATQGLVVQSGSRWSSVLNSRGNDVSINGETVPIAVLKQRLQAAAGGLPTSEDRPWR